MIATIDNIYITKHIFSDLEIKHPNLVSGYYRCTSADEDDFKFVGWGKKECRYFY